LILPSFFSATIPSLLCFIDLCKCVHAIHASAAALSRMSMIALLAEGSVHLMTRDALRHGRERVLLQMARY
jgi:hypothetical protein